MVYSFNVLWFLGILVLFQSILYFVLKQFYCFFLCVSKFSYFFSSSVFSYFLAFFFVLFSCNVYLCFSLFPHDFLEFKGRNFDFLPGLFVKKKAFHLFSKKSSWENQHPVGISQTLTSIFFKNLLGKKSNLISRPALEFKEIPRKKEKHNTW